MDTIMILLGGVVVALILYILWIKRSGATALHLAATHDEIETALDLLASSSNPNAKDRSGRTPLFQAIISGSPEFVDLLLEAGADPNIRDKHDEISLHHVSSRRALSGAGQIIIALFQHGANPKAQNMNGETPYERASRLGRDLIAEAIMQEVGDE